MSAITKGFYHCNACDSVFESDIIGVDSQYCPECGKEVVGILDDGLSSASQSSNQALFSEEDKAEQIVGGNAQEKSIPVDDSDDGDDLSLDKNKVATQLRAIFIGWILLVILVVGIAIHFNRQAEDLTESPQQASKNKRQIALEKHALKLAIPNCVNAITGFLGSTTPAGKAQYVYDGIRLSPEIEAFYANNPDFDRRDIQVKVVEYHDLNIADLNAIGTLCQLNTGERFEVVFIRDGQDWKIEWKSLVRYSPTDWSLFSSSENGEESEFRLYMRVLDVGRDLAGNDIMVKFYKPDVYRGGSYTGYASESVRVPAFSAAGELIAAMTRKRGENNGEDHVGMKIADFDPEHYHRVRVRVRLRKTLDGDPYLELVDLLANHWYDPEIVKQSGLPKLSD
jgi:predicted RNA-binding Zn-ribbon protein involved in translation (DUF1610 family)